MINLYNAQLKDVYVHKIGNKSRNESVFLSELPLPLNDETAGLLKEFFFKPFRKAEESYYKFTNDVDVEFNEVYQACADIFDNPNDLLDKSHLLANLLYSESAHPHIKSGELYIVFIENIMLDNNKTNAIGIFKSEIKKDFMQFEEGGSRLEMELKQGIDLSKLDKGALIFDVEREEGFKVMSVDSNKYDTKYWLEAFLDLGVFEDENFLTKKYLKFCQDFGKDVVLPAEDKLEQISFQSSAGDYFAKHDEFNEDDFLEEVLDNPALRTEFKHYKNEKGAKHSVEDISGFDIANKAVTGARKKFKNVIKLDTGVEIKINIVNPDMLKSTVQKGWDEERQMYYYLVYFNKEEK